MKAELNARVRWLRADLGKGQHSERHAGNTIGRVDFDTEYVCFVEGSAVADNLVRCEHKYRCLRPTNE